MDSSCKFGCDQGIDRCEHIMDCPRLWHCLRRYTYLLSGQLQGVRRLWSLLFIGPSATSGDQFLSDIACATVVEIIIWTHHQCKVFCSPRDIHELDAMIIARARVWRRRNSVTGDALRC